MIAHSIHCSFQILFPEHTKEDVGLALRLGPQKMHRNWLCNKLFLIIIIT